LLIHTVVSAFPDMAVGSARAPTFRGLLSVHSRYGLHTSAVTVFRDTPSRRLQLFITSIAAPVLTAGAVAGWDLHPLEKRRLITAHAKSGLRQCHCIAVIEQVCMRFQ